MPFFQYWQYHGCSHFSLLHRWSILRYDGLMTARATDQLTDQLLVFEIRESDRDFRSRETEHVRNRLLRVRSCRRAASRASTATTGRDVAGASDGYWYITDCTSCRTTSSTHSRIARCRSSPRVNSWNAASEVRRYASQGACTITLYGDVFDAHKGGTPPAIDP
jgi:hypothetical protein